MKLEDFQLNHQTKTKMKTNIKSYGPALALALIIAVSAPFMRPVQSQTLADRLNRINATRERTAPDNQPVQESHFVVVLSGYESEGNMVVDVSSSSMNAPVFQHGDNLAQALKVLRDAGATISIHAWGYLTYTATK